jgi:anti-sigma factor RsiW
VTCREVEEYISPAVDGRLEQSIKSEFEQHLSQCVDCRSEFELERLTKNFVRISLPSTPAPAGFSQRIQNNLETVGESGSQQQASVRSWLVPQWKPALAVGAIAIAAIFLFVSLPVTVRHSHTSPDDNDIIHQSFNNYDAVMAGTMTPALTSSNYDEVRSYFAKHLTYPAKVPRMDKCALIGGLVSEYQGKQLAHLVYRVGDELIYMYQVDMPTIMEGKTLMLSEHAKQELLRTGWYVVSSHPKCSLVMWLVDETICTAVADIDQNELIAFLSYSQE